MFEARLISAALVGMILILATPADAHDPSAYGGLFRSRDAGVTWFSANPGRIVSGAIALAVSPIEPTHLLLATDSGLLRSRNAGRDWSLEAPSLLVGAVFAVAFDTDGRRALASTGSALFRSDEARSGRRVTAPPGTLPARLLVPDRPGRVYLVGWQQLLRERRLGDIVDRARGPAARDAGHAVARRPWRRDGLRGRRRAAVGEGRGDSAWRPIDAGLPHGSIDAVAADARDPRRLWATARGQVFRSDDGGASWAPWGHPSTRRTWPCAASRSRSPRATPC